MADIENLVDGSLASYLPQELLLNIFSLLPLSDVKICRSVCMSWAWSASLQLSERSSLDFRESLKQTSNIGLITPLSIAAFKSLKLRKVSISFSSDSIASQWVWAPVVAGSTSLILDKCCINERDFLRILSHSIRIDQDPNIEDSNLSDPDGKLKCQKENIIKCSRLKSLALIDTRELFMSGCLISQPNDKEIVSMALKNVISLDISRNSYMTDVLFKRLTDCMPKLQILLLNEINIQHHPGIYKKYYPEHVLQTSHEEDLETLWQDKQIFDSPSIFTYGCFLQFLRNKASQIRKLGLQCTNLPDLVLRKIACIPQLSLSSLDISKNPGIKQPGMKQLVGSQGCYLTELNVSFCRRIAMDYHPDLMQIFQNLPTLKKLVLHGISCTRGFDECLSFLENLEYLDITDCDIPARHLADGIVKPLEEAQMAASALSKSTVNQTVSIDHKSTNPHNLGKNNDCSKKLPIEEGVARMKIAAEHCCARKLGVLILSRYCRAPDQLLRILKWTTNLALLNFNGCALNHESVQQIFRTLNTRSLKDLNLNRCEGVDDLGYECKNSSSIVIPNNFPIPELACNNEALREYLNKKSKTEVNTKSTNLDIGNLKTLTTLRICGSLVTSSTILSAFHFYDLRTIDVSECKNITTAGFIALASQNPHIENLIAKSCNGLNDTGLISIACCLKRLIHLDVESSYEVTSTALASGCEILSALQLDNLYFSNPSGLRGCTFLRYLNVSRCPEINFMAIDALVEKIGPFLRVKMDEELIH